MFGNEEHGSVSEVIEACTALFPGERNRLRAMPEGVFFLVDETGLVGVNALISLLIVDAFDSGNS